ncbi:unnamed protein product [Paramecium pentaurelia]|uniref:Uncharacterized protein n=1 Tax=Paramecium pentaurelia TaxID=43138 RepID=A0A8S1WG84_9CILI|nr:unnamed protein product [Paramecium pentaurelia]
MLQQQETKQKCQNIDENLLFIWNLIIISIKLKQIQLKINQNRFTANQRGTCQKNIAKLELQRSCCGLHYCFQITKGTQKNEYSQVKELTAQERLERFKKH